MNLRNIKTIALLIVVTLSSCTKFLEEKPALDTGIRPETVSDLISYYYAGSESTHEYYRILGNDDASLPFSRRDIVDENGMSKRVELLTETCFLRDFRKKVATGGATLWSTNYKSINNNNYLLSLVDSKDIEGTDAERKKLISYARFNRARAYFALATTFCQPYKAGVNDGDLGLVIRDKYNYDLVEDNLKRKSLKETYDFITADIEASMNVDDGDAQWKITKGAVYAFAARYYLMIGEYAKSEEYADLALEQNRSVNDYTTYSTKVIPLGNSQNVEVLSEFNDLEFTNNLVHIPEEYYIERIQVFTYPFFPSNELINLYDNSNNQVDMRRKLFPANGVGASGYLSTRSTSPTVRKPYYVGYNSGTYMLTYPNVPEVMLIKAECAAEKGDLGTAKGMLNDLRIKRIKNYNSAVVDQLSSKDDVLNFIYDERRREKPFVLRGLDIRRLKANKGMHFNIVRRFFEMNTFEIITPPIRKDYIFTDECYADKIWETDLNLSNGYLQQNP